MEFFNIAIKYALNLALNIFKVFPVNNFRVFLLNDLSYTYGCNPKYICKYLAQEYHDTYEIIYPLKKDTERNAIPKGVITVIPKSFRYFYYIMTSKVIITNSGGVSYIPFHKNQRVINTWHGGGGYKKGGIDVIKSKSYLAETKLNAKKVTYMLASTQLMIDAFSPSLLIDKSKFLRIGIPRIDMFFGDTSEYGKKVRDYYHIPAETKIIMYCPTFRRSETESFALKEAIIDQEELLKLVKGKWGGDWCFAERRHPKIKVGNRQTSNKSFDFTAYPDMQELLCAVDIVISDYSGLIWDYSFTKKPCFIFAEDIYEYSKDVGFYAPIEKWPYPIATTAEELKNNIKNYNQKEYEKKVEAHYQDLGSYEKGTACQSVGDLIYKFCKEEEGKQCPV